MARDPDEAAAREAIVKNLERAEAFYQGVLGLESGLRQQERWMPARSIYFSDPDGHELELCAPLAG